MGDRFAPECSQTQESYMSIFFFFSAIFAVARFVEIQKFCYHGNVM